MKNTLLAGTTAMMTLLVSCKKEQPGIAPVIETIKIDLAQKEIQYGAGPVVLDFDKDGTRDFIFNVTLVGDPVLQVDKRKFNAVSGINSLFPLNQNQEVYCMSKGDSISLQNFDGYEWNLVEAATLVERRENIAGDITWHGNWKQAVKKYLPFQLNIQNKKHAGWIELSIDTAAQKVVLHRAAYTKNAGISIKAGE